MHVAARLRRDGARGVAILPLRPSEPWWCVIMDGCLHMEKFDGVISMDLPVAAAFATDPRSFSEWAVVAFDYGNSYYAPCEQEPKHETTGVRDTRTFQWEAQGNLRRTLASSLAPLEIPHLWSQTYEDLQV